jgi:archaellum biogenesis protein FlaJ (TadC family)
MSELLDFIKPFIALIGVISFLVFLISLVSVPWLVAKIPEDYFLHHKRKKTLPVKRAAWVRYLALKLARNTLGLILLTAGFFMLFIPGQGLLTIVMGLVLMDYPGKYALEKKIISYPVVIKGLNWLRFKANKPPLRNQ